MYGKEYARITQGAEYTWISLIYDNDLRHERVNNTEYEYIAQDHYNLLSSYRDWHVFRTLSNI